MTARAASESFGRREFLKHGALGVGAAATAAGLGAGPAAAQLPPPPASWDREVDVVVIGSGFAGLAAAIEARDAGASVVILEKMPALGGNSTIAGGVYNCVDPPRQQAAGITDSTDLHFQQTIAGGDFRADPDKVRYFVENALDGWTWLEKQGVELAKLYQVYGALHPPTHSPRYKGRVAGGAIVSALADQAKARQIPLLLEHKVVALHRERPLDGRVIGVSVDADGKKLAVRARRGVVLAAGGFNASIELRQRHDPRWSGRFGTTNHSGATGEILLMAEDVGGSTTGLDYIQNIGPTGPDARFVKPPVGTIQLIKSPMMMIGGLTVNACVYVDLRGNRIVAADARRDAITEAVMRTPEQVCVGIGDDVSRTVADFGPYSVEEIDKVIARRPREMFRADTLRELAQKIGMPDPAVFERAIAKYNAAVETKSDPEFGQLPHNLTWKCQKPPFLACTASPAPHHMCGGLRTQTSTALVLDRWNRVIPGLYAAGEIVGGVHGTNRLGGNATADCIVFGRLAGRQAAKA